MDAALSFFAVITLLLVLYQHGYIYNAVRMTPTKDTGTVFVFFGSVLFPPIVHLI